MNIGTIAIILLVIVSKNNGNNVPGHKQFGNELCKLAFLQSKNCFTSCSPLGIRLLLSYIALATDNPQTKIELKRHLLMDTHTDKRIKSNVNFAHQLIQLEHTEENGLDLKDFVSEREENGTVWQNIIRMECKLIKDMNGNEKYGTTEDTVHITDRFMYGKISEFQSQFIKIPCQNLPNTHLYIVIPTVDLYVNNVAHNIHNHTVNHFNKYGSYNTVHVELPKDFLIETHLDLKPYLQQLGIQKMFQTEHIREISQEIELEISTPHTSTSHINEPVDEHFILDRPFFIVADFNPDTLFITKINPVNQISGSNTPRPESTTSTARTPLFEKQKPNCQDSRFCKDYEVCKNGKCVPVCQQNTCASNAYCLAMQHKSKCKCPEGYGGDPRIYGCTKL